MSELRIPLDHSLPGKPNNNSLAERTNQEVINTVSTALLHAGLPAQYWTYALNCVMRNLNMEDVEGDGDSAWKRMTGDEFKGKAIPFGAKVFFQPTDTRDKTYGHKFGPNGIPGIFAGYIVTTGQNGKEVSRLGHERVCECEPVYGCCGSQEACSALPDRGNTSSQRDHVPVESRVRKDERNSRRFKGQRESWRQGDQRH